MKILIMLMVLMVSMSCSKEKKEMAMEMSDEAKLMQPKMVNMATMNDPILDHYFMIQEKLVNDKKDEINSYAMEINKALELSEYKDKEIMMMAAKAVSEAKTIAEVRIAFKPLSDQMIAYAEHANLSSNVYLMHCPMAFDNKGADWLQNSEKLYNPYYGSRMLTCGSTKRTISAK